MQVGQHDVLADTDPACDGLTDLAGADDDDDLAHDFLSWAISGFTCASEQHGTVAAQQTMRAGGCPGGLSSRHSTQTLWSLKAFVEATVVPGGS
jgi:hypothetical protein